MADGKWILWVVTELIVFTYIEAWETDWKRFRKVPCMPRGWDSSVGIVTCHGIGSWWRRDYPHPFRLAPGPTQPPIQWVPGLSEGGKAARVWHWPATPIWHWGWRKSRAITVLPLWAFVACSRVTFTLLFMPFLHATSLLNTVKPA
jgi:hypothetical protein